LLIVLAVVSLSFGALGGWVAIQKRREPYEGAILGILFGPVGVLVEALLPIGDAEPKTRRGPLGGSPLGFKLVAAYKLVGAVLLFGAGIGVFRLLKRDVGEELEHWIAQLRLDPHGHFLQVAVSRLSGVPRSRLRAIGFGTFFYAALSTVEGVGLLLQRRWAGYLTVFATASLVPVEIWELTRKFNAVRVAVLAVNVAIVIFLIWKLREERRAEATTPSVRGADAP